MYYSTSSLNLSFLMLQERGGSHSAAPFVYVIKKNNSSFYSTRRLQQALTLRWAQALPTDCAAVLSPSLNNQRSQKTTGLHDETVPHFVLMWEITEMWGRKKQREEDVSVPLDSWIKSFLILTTGTVLQYNRNSWPEVTTYTDLTT